MSKISKNNRIKKINELLNIVKLKISISDNAGSVKFTIHKFNNQKQKPYYYVINEIKFKNIFTAKFESEWAYYATHEIAHHIVSSKSRRSKRDYGLINKPKSFSLYEESKVIIVNNYLRNYFKFVKRDDVFYNLKGYIKGNSLKLKEWWETEGEIIAKTYANLV